MVLFVAAAGVVAAVVVGLPALRLRGLFLAVTTLAFAVVAADYLTQADWLVSNAGTGSLQMFRPDSHGINLNDELTYYYFVLGIALVGALMVHQLSRTGVARKMRAVRDNEAMAAALSVSPSSTKVTAFVLSGVMATVAGLFYGMLLFQFSSGDLFSPQLSLTLLTMVIIGGTTSITGAILGALYMGASPTS